MIKKFPKDSDIPSFLFSFLDLKSLYNCEDEQEIILFNNKEILIDSFFFTTIGLKKVNRRQYPGCQRVFFFVAKLRFPQIFSSALRKKAKPDVNFLSGGSLFHLSSVLTIDLLNIRSKAYYWLFLDKRKS